MILVSLSTVFFLLGVNNELVHGAGSEVAKNARFKRSLTPCIDKYKVISGHTACLSVSNPPALLDVVPQNDRDLIVAKHNEYRSDVSPTAANMMQISWDEETAMIAQVWAEQCTFKHDQGKHRDIPGKFSLGQNIAIGAKGWLEAMTLWGDEKKYFQFGKKNILGKVGHYTQMVWASTNKIGCGVAKCGSSLYHVCNYGPAGNSGDLGVPYKSGTPCGDCKTCNRDKLCECGLTCLNGGTLNPSSCTCTCRQSWPFYIFNNCSLDCGRVKTDPKVCQSDTYKNLPCRFIASDCPNKCRVCPYGSFDYINKGHSSAVDLGPNFLFSVLWLRLCAFVL